MRSLILSLVVLLAASSRVASAAWTIRTLDPTTNSGWSMSMRLAGLAGAVDGDEDLPHAAYWTAGQGFFYYDGVTSVPAGMALPPEAATPADVQLLLTGVTAIAVGNLDSDPWIAEALIDQNAGSQGTLVVKHRSQGVWTSETIGTTSGQPSIDFDYVTRTVYLFYRSPAGPVYAWRTASGWTSEAFDSASSYGVLALDRKRTPCIAYISASGRLRFAKRVGSSWQDQLVDASTPAASPSLAFSGTNHPRIAYADRTGGGQASSLRYAEESVGTWTSQPVSVAGASTWQFSLAVGGGDFPFIAFHDLDVDYLRVAARTNGIWTAETVDPQVGSGEYPSARVTPDATPVIAYKADSPSGSRIATGTRIVGIEPLALRGVRLSSGANPSRRGAAVALTASVPVGGEARLLAFDAAGRAVGAAQSCMLLPGSNRIDWIAPARAGLVFLQLETSSGENATTRVVVF